MIAVAFAHWAPHPLYTLILTLVCLPFIVSAIRYEWKPQAKRILIAFFVACVLSSAVVWADEPPPPVKVDCEYLWWTLECLLWGLAA
jgi:hypothetical protein